MRSPTQTMVATSATDPLGHEHMRLATTAIALLATGSCLIAAAPPGTAEPSRAASHTSGNLIRNAGAEKTTPAPSSDGTAKVALAHWKVPKKDRFTAVAYGSPEFLAKKAAGPSGRGKNFFSGGSHGRSSKATQTIGLSAYAGWVKAGARFTLAGWLGGFESQRDRAVVKVVWLDRHGKALVSAHIGPVTAKDRDDRTVLLKRATSGSVPAHSVTARVVITMSHADGTYVDGYADKLALVLRKG